MKYSTYILDKRFSLVMENRWSKIIQKADTVLFLVSCKCNYIKPKLLVIIYIFQLECFDTEQKCLKKINRSKGYVKCALTFLHILFRRGDKSPDSGASEITP